MSELMQGPAQLVAAWLLTYALHSTALLGVVALVTWRWIASDAWRDALWKAALLGGMLTSSLQLAVNVQPLGGQWQLWRSETASFETTVSVPPAVSMRTNPEALLNSSNPVSDVVSSNDVVNRNDNSASTSAARWSSLRAVSPVVWLVSVWLVIAAALLLRLAWHHVRLFRALRDRQELVNEPAATQLALLCRQAGVWRRVRLSVAACNGPLALGGSEICVPRRFLERLDADAQRSALAHELAHLARRDPTWHLLAGVVERIFFFQPLNRLARLRLRESAEHLADDWAVRYTEAPLALARCLSEVAGWIEPRAVRIPSGTLAMTEGGSPLMRRVERLLECAPTTMPALHLRLLAVVMLLAASVVIVPGAAAHTVADAVTPAAAPTVDDVFPVTTSPARQDPQRQDPKRPGRNPASTVVVPKGPPALAELDAQIASTRPLRERQEAVEQLAAWSAELSVPRLIHIAWNSPIQIMQLEAVETLGEVRARSAIDALDQIIDEHPAVVVQLQAVEALAGLARRAAAPRLLELARTHAQPRVRSAALDELSDLVGNNTDLTSSTAEAAIRRELGAAALRSPPRSYANLSFERSPKTNANNNAANSSATVNASANASATVNASTSSSAAIKKPHDDEQLAWTTAITAAQIYCESSTSRIDIKRGEWVSLKTYVHGARIEGWDESYAQVDARECAISRERLAEARVEITSRNGGHHIESRYQDPRKINWNLDDPNSPENPATFQYVIRVPRWASVRNVELAGGRLDIHHIAGDVQAFAANGPVLASELGGAVRLSSANGPVRLTLSQSPGGSVHLSSVYGVVTLELPATAAANLSAETEGGDIVSDVPLGSGRRRKGTVGGGGEPVLLSSTYSRVRLHLNGNSSGNAQQNDDHWTSERIPLTPGMREAARANGQRYVRGAQGLLVQTLLVATQQPKQGDTDLVAERATWALAQMRSEDLITPLLRAAASSDWRERTYAAWSLGAIADMRGADALLAALEDPHWRVRMTAAYGSGTLKDRRAVPALQRMLDDPRWQVRIAAVENLQTIADRDALSALSKALQDSNAIVRDAARAALETPRRQ